MESPITDLSIDEYELNLDEFNNLSFVENELESHVEFSSHKAAEHENDIFQELKDCGITVTSANSEYGQNKENSWDIYTRLAQLYNLVIFSCLKNQFSSNTINVQLFNLCSNDVKSLSEALMENTQVTTFNLTGNKLDTTGCCYLSDLLQKNNVIKHLDISRCKIESSGAIALGRHLRKSVLKTLNLSYNNIGHAGLQSLLEALQTNTYLQELDLSNNGIQSECIDDISIFIEINESVEQFNLSGNFLNKKTDLTPLMKTIEVLNQNLQELILQWNGISGNECANIFKNLIIKTERLKILDLSWNNFRNVGSILGIGIKKTTALENLDISNNPLTTDDLVTLLNCVVLPTSLRILGITHVLVDEQLEKAISNAKLRVSTFNVQVGLYTKIKTELVDLQALYLQRIHFLGVEKPKKEKNKIDFGHTLLKIENEANLEPMTKTVFLSLFTKLKIKGSGEVIEELAKVFKNPKKKIDVALMLDKYLKLYPDTKL